MIELEKQQNSYLEAKLQNSYRKAVELEDENGGVWLVNGYIAQEKWQLDTAD